MGTFTLKYTKILGRWVGQDYGIFKEISYVFPHKLLLDILILFIPDIAMVAFSPLGNPGFIGEKDGVPSLFDDPVLRSIANNRKITVAQVYFDVKSYFVKFIKKSETYNVSLIIIIIRRFTSTTELYVNPNPFNKMIKLNCVVKRELST